MDNKQNNAKPSAKHIEHKIKNLLINGHTYVHDDDGNLADSSYCKVHT